MAVGEGRLPEIKNGKLGWKTGIQALRPPAWEDRAGESPHERRLREPQEDKCAKNTEWVLVGGIYVEMNILAQQSLWSGLTIGSIYALIALGFTVIFNVSKILNIAQGEFVMVGALSFYSFVTTLHSPFWIAILVTLLIAAFVGWLMVTVAIHPLKNPAILTLIIVTIAFGEILKGVALLIWGNDTFSIPPMVRGKAVQIFSAYVQPQVFVIIGVSLAIYFGFTWMNRKTNFGRSLTATAGDPYAATLVGINVKRLTLVVFMIGSGMGAIAGILAGPITTMSYYQGTMLGIKAFIAALLGGLGSYGGAMIGGLALGLLESFGAGFISSTFKDVFAFAVLLIVLLVSPNGILGIKGIFANKKK